MPMSSQSGKASIKWVMSKLPEPKTALDIGCGEGTYAKLFPKLAFTGVEIWEPYAEKYGLQALYQNFILQDAREFSTDEHFDVCFLGDVLEHMTVSEATALLEKAKGWADTVIISIPIGHYPQDEYEGNPYERHVKDDWSDAQVKEAFGKPTWSTVDAEIGVYAYSKHKIALAICVYAISKNEEQFVDRFCQSAKDADLILIADTGSTDETAAKAREHGAVVHDICISPWRFDIARNTALALIPRDIDICISLDLDELLEPGWREEMERVWINGTTRLRYFFDWGAGIRFKYEKIHARHGYRWHHPCHEYPVTDPRIKEVWADSDMLMVTHHPDPTKSRGQYLELLAMSVKEDPLCPRNAFYYARELSFYAKWEEALKELNRYLSLPDATWHNERCYAMRIMGKCHEELGDLGQAEKWFHLAAAEAPNTREPWCALAMLMYMQNRWEECLAFSMRALKIVDKQLVYTCDPAVWGHMAHDLACVAAWRLGLNDISIAQAKLACEKSPDDARLAKNLAFLTGKLEQDVKEEVS